MVRYSYDKLGRLTREDNSFFGKSYFFTYDDNGNILTKETAYITWGDHIAGSGEVIAYGYEGDKLI